MFLSKYMIAYKTRAIQFMGIYNATKPNTVLNASIKYKKTSGNSKTNSPCGGDPQIYKDINQNAQYYKCKNNIFNNTVSSNTSIILKMYSVLYINCNIT